MNTGKKYLCSRIYGSITLFIFLFAIYPVIYCHAQQIATGPCPFGIVKPVFLHHLGLASATAEIATSQPGAASLTVTPAVQPGSISARVPEANGLILKEIQKFNLAELKFSGIHQFQWKNAPMEFRAANLDVPNFTEPFPTELKWNGATFTVSALFNDGITISSFSMNGFVNVASKSVSGIFATSFRKPELVDQTWEFRLNSLPFRRLASDSVTFFASGDALKEFLTMISCIHLPNFGKFIRTDFSGKMPDIQSSHLKYPPFLSFTLFKE